MKLGAVFKLDKRNTTMSKKIDGDFISTKCDFQFTDNLEPSGSRILDAWSIKLAFLLIETFYLLKTENRTKKSLT